MQEEEYKKVEQAIKNGLATYSQEHRKGKKPVEQGHVDKVLSAFKEVFSAKRTTPLSDLELMFLEGSVKDKMQTYYHNRSTLAKPLKGSPKTITEQGSKDMASEIVEYINDLLPHIANFERAIDDEITVQFELKGIQRLSDSGIEFLKEKEKEILKIYYDARSASKQALKPQQNMGIMTKCKNKVKEVVEDIAKKPELVASREYSTQAIGEMIKRGDLPGAANGLKKINQDLSALIDASNGSVNPMKPEGGISFEDAMAQTVEHMTSGNAKAAEESVRSAMLAKFERDDKRYQELEKRSEGLTKEAERFQSTGRKRQKGGRLGGLFGK